MNDDFRDGLQMLTSYAAMIGSSLPGITFFTDHAPPMFSPVAVLATVFCSGFVLYGFVKAPSKTKIPGRAASLLIFSVTLLIAFSWLQQYTTATPPGESSPRIQIGFGMQPWSLTDEARALIEENAKQEEVATELTTPGDLLQAYGVWAGRNTQDKIWVWWIKDLAGMLLTFLYMVGFILWSVACGMLSKYFHLSKKRKSAAA